MIDVEMPQMGESIVEGTLTKWLKKPGDKVERDEPLFEISTDKVDTEIPSPAAGTLAEILVEEGKTVGINTVVGRISDGSGAAAPSASKQAPAPAPQPAQAAPQAAPSAPPSAPPPPASQSDGAAHEEYPAAAPAGDMALEQGPGPLSPLVRKMARENNIDLNRVKGTGVGGRITKQDLEAYLAGQARPQAAPPSTAPAQTAMTPAAPQRPVSAPAPQPPPAQMSVSAPPREVAPPAPSPAPMAGAPPVMPGAPPAMRVEPMSIMRQKIAEHMIFSKHTSAHVTTVHKTD